MQMNRKEIACAAVGVMLSAVGCAPSARSSALPVDGAEQNASHELDVAANKKSPHLNEAILSLISGTTRDMSSAIFQLAPKSGWSVTSNNKKLQVSIEEAYKVLLQAPEDESVHAIGIATITHDDGTTFMVRCHIEPC
jgi:hypothetical protein